MTVLVGYATAHGSTHGVAERIATRIREHGRRVECMPMTQVQDVDRYAAAVLGSALHGRAWLPEAAQFVADHAGTLAGRPVWMFSVGMTGALARPLRSWAMREGPAAIAQFQDAVRPRGSRLFSGVVRRQHFPLPGRLVLRLMGGRYGDFRNWAEIDAWADDIARRLPAQPPTAGEVTDR